MLHYILQTIVFQLLFLILYDLFLKKETFFNWNRVYLLGTSIMSLMLPFIKLESLRNVVPKDLMIILPEVIIGNQITSNPKGVILEGIDMGVSDFNTLEIIILIGISIALVIFLVKMFSMIYMIQDNPKYRRDDLLIVKLLDSSKAFSFFNYVFLGEKINYDDRDSILEHEIIHVRDKHSLDLIYFEILRIVFWFNPLVYIYQNRISTLHEFTADAKAVKNHELKIYYQKLLSQVFETQNLSFINTFFKKSLIKKRIVMLSKSRSRQVNIVKYVLLIPMVLGMIFYTSCVQENGQDDKVVQEKSILQNTSLIEKIEAVKSQIEIQGNTTNEEHQGFDLLLRTVTGTELDPELVKEVQLYTASKNKTPLMQKVTEVFEQIQKQGNISDDEEKALKGFLVFVTEDGLNNPALQDGIEIVEVPFGVIDEVPVFPGCETLTKEEQKKCMVEMVTKHVMQNFNTKVADSLKLSGKMKISSMFIINNKGVVENIKARAPHPALEKETLRVLDLLPDMTPGMQSGKPVNVPFALPIIFQLKE